MVSIESSVMRIGFAATTAAVVLCPESHAPTINPRMKLISLSKSNLCPGPHPLRTPHSAVVFGGRPPRAAGTTTKHHRHDLPIA